MNAPVGELLKQHLIDPEICIRCNTCEETCPVDAVTHDGNNYVVDATICNHCMDCISPCPTGSIDNWRVVAKPYSLEEQFSWSELPAQQEMPTADSGAVEGSAVSTIEGVATDGALHHVQHAFIDESAMQCGYCIPGFIMAAVALLEREPRPSRDAVRQALAGNLCRCGVYLRIERAVMRAAAQTP